MVFFRLRRHGDAVQAFRRALELHPNFALAHVFLGISLVNQRAYEEAIKSAEQALRLSPNDRLFSAYASFAKGFAHFAGEDYANSVRHARDSIEKYPDYEAAHYLLIASSALHGDQEAAAEALAILLRWRPYFSLAWMSENMPYIGEIGQRFLDGFRKAGVPEA